MLCAVGTSRVTLIALCTCLASAPGASECRRMCVVDEVARLVRTLILRDLHRLHPARDFLCERRGGMMMDHGLIVSSSCPCACDGVGGVDCRTAILQRRTRGADSRGPRQG